MSASPIVAILRVGNPGNPFEVLGLPVGPVSESDVIDALAERMRLIAVHPLSETPEGNEVRLAVHAAAAQLLDSAIRSALLERAGIVESRAKLPRTPRAARPPETALGPRALMVIASEGGWNPRAMRRIALLAHAAGVASSSVPRVVRDLAGDSRQRETSAVADRRGTTPRRADPKQAVAGTAPVGFTAIAAAVAILLLGVTWISLSARSRPDAAQAAAPQQIDAPPTSSNPETTSVGSPPDEVAAEAPERVIPAPSLDQPDWSLALIAIRDAKEQTDAETAVRIADGIAESWYTRDRNELSGIANAFVDVVFLMNEDDATQLVSAMADRIRERRASTASFHAGLLSRLSFERSLPTPVDNAIISAMVSTIGTRQRAIDAPFERGASRGLQYVARGWTESAADTEELRDWLAVVDLIGRGNSDLAGRVVRDAAESLLRAQRDVVGDTDSLRAIEALAERMDPTTDAEAAGLVLRLLADEGIPVRAASALVNAIARNQPPGGTAAPIRLAATASATDRSSVRARLAEQWLQQTEATSDSSAVAASIERHRDGDIPSTPQGLIADTVVSARLSNACQFLLWGAPSESTSLVSSLRTDLDRILSQRPSGRSSSANSGDAWAIRYLEAKRNIPVRLSLLNEMVQRSGSLGAIAAEIVVAEAVNGSPARVRREAQSVVAVNADEPAVINAVLEVLPTAPRVRSVGELVERVSARSLPAINDPGWPFEARRAVVDRLLELESGSRESDAIDRLAALLADEYSRLATNGSSTTNALDESMRHVIESRLEQIQRIDLAGAAAPRVAELLQRRAGRLALAEGAVTRFAAEQVTAVELLAVIVELETPHLRGVVREEMDQLARGRGESRDAFEQIARTERAGLTLWSLRVGVEL